MNFHIQLCRKRSPCSRFGFTRHSLYDRRWVLPFSGLARNASPAPLSTQGLARLRVSQKERLVFPGILDHGRPRFHDERLGFRGYLLFVD